MSTRANVLKALEENKGATISGEELASRLDISRAAIWKAIQELRREGYRIEAATNKGYCLSQESDVLSAEGILPHLRRNETAGRIHVFKVLESTNLTAKKMALDGAPHGTVVVSEEQTKGRGRMGRSFFSPPTGGIYMSFILAPKLEAAKSVLITTAASVAVCRAIEAVTGISCKIKWVNDIYLDGKKVCGILTEAVSDFESGHIDYIVLGIGINFSTAAEAFPKELSGIAGSLISAVSAEGISRNRLIAEVIDQVLEINEDLESRQFLEDYRNRSFILGKEILVIPRIRADNESEPAEGMPATALDIDGDGGLVVRYRDGSVQTLNSGEISIRPISADKGE
jgi:BirA family biotin operon repressor/biotin-[acetyl-CoA-carboxylase] ligase